MAAPHDTGPQAGAASLVTPAWYCIRTKPKHEHIAAANLRQLEGVDIFSPRLRSRKATRRGPVWVTESLFPNYLFARFDFHEMFEPVKYSRGVSRVVHFGIRYPIIPEEIVEELRRNFTEDELRLSHALPAPGDAVTITSMAMFGFKGVVLRTLPAKKRVQVLLDMLGQTTTVDLSVNSVAVDKKPLPHHLLAN